MGAVILGAAVLVPFALLVAGLLALGSAMPANRDDPTAGGWVAPATLALLVPGSVLLLFLLAWRGDSETSAWSATGGEVHGVAVAALVLGGGAFALQLGLMLRDEHGAGPRLRSAGAALAGVAMLVLFTALVTVWFTGVR